MNQEQLVFNFPKNEHFTFDNFLSGGNRELTEYLQRLGRGEFSGTHRINLLVGPSGMGKSHLLTATYATALQFNINSLYLNMQEIMPLGPDILMETGELDLLFFDDMDLVAGQREWEVAVFDLINRVLEHRKCHLILSSKSLPKEIGCGLPDLVSRLQWGQCMHLKDLSEEDKMTFLIEKAKQRDFDLPVEVSRYLLSRMPRDLRSLQEIIEQLDRLSLQSHRKLTIPFVKDVFQLS